MAEPSAEQMPWIAAIGAAPTCELVWLGTDGAPNAVPATPLLHRGRPAVAFPYAAAATGRALGAAAEAAMVLSDDRLTGSSWRPLAVLGRPVAVEDTGGELFTADLLPQELAKHPPSRALADSILLRRENWWYLPRVIVTLEPAAVRDVPARPGGRGTVLGVASRDGLRVESRPATDLVEAVDPAQVDLGVPDGEAVVLRHDFSEPDLERWVAETTYGRITRGRFTAERTVGDPVLPPPWGLLTRLRRHRRLARDCRRALARR